MYLTCVCDEEEMYFTIREYKIDGKRIYFYGEGTVKRERSSRIRSVSFDTTLCTIRMEPLKSIICIETKKRKCIIEHATPELIGDIVTELHNF